jgi:hypothetical protein
MAKFDLSRGLIKTDLAILFRETPLVSEENRLKMKGGSTEVIVGRMSKSFPSACTLDNWTYLVCRSKR